MLGFTWFLLPFYLLFGLLKPLLRMILLGFAYLYLVLLVILPNASYREALALPTEHFSSYST